MKRAGLLLVVLLLLGGLEAQVAWGQTGVITSDGPFLLDAVDEGEGPPFLTAFGGQTGCETISYLGGEVGATDEAGNHEALESGAGAFTLTPLHNGCMSAGGLPETVRMNGCDYVVHLGKTVPTSTDRYNVTTDIICPKGEEIAVDIYADESAHVEAPEEPLCRFHIPPQEGLIGGTITDEAKSNHLLLGAKVEGVEMTLTQGPCALEGDIVETEGVFHLNATIAGTDAPVEGEVTPLSLSH